MAIMAGTGTGAHTIQYGTKLIVAVHLVGVLETSSVALSGCHGICLYGE